MISPAGTSLSADLARPRWSLRHALVALAAARAAAGSAGQLQPQLHPSFFVFLLLIAAWCLGEPMPSDEP